MTVKEAVYSAATLLGCLESVQYYIEEDDDEGKEVAELMLHCFNLVENELALDYLPLTAEEERTTNTGKVVFSNLSNSVVRIIKVMNENGESIAYQLFPDHLMTQEGKVKIVYAYTPAQKTWTDKSDFELYVSARLFGYGIAAEYCAAVGRFEEANVWDEKYKDAIEAAYRVRSGGKMSSRRWV